MLSVNVGCCFRNFSNLIKPGNGICECCVCNVCIVDEFECCNINNCSGLRCDIFVILDVESQHSSYKLLSDVG